MLMPFHPAVGCILTIGVSQVQQYQLVVLTARAMYIPRIMTDETGPLDRIRNIWAPWRMEYIESLSNENDEGCFLCRGRDEDDDEKNLILWRGQHCFAVLNRFPYTGGHALVAPLAHIADLADMTGAAMGELMEMLRDLQHLLSQTINAEGFNVGINIGQCAGAGLPGHLHAHIVPRWRGDTNFMSVFGDVRVIPTSLASLYTQLTNKARELHLPKLSSSKGE